MAAEGAEVMVATHNQGSIEATVRLMGEMGLEPPRGAGVFFGQLLGILDSDDRDSLGMCNLVRGEREAV